MAIYTNNSSGASALKKSRAAFGAKKKNACVLFRLLCTEVYAPLFTFCSLSESNFLIFIHEVVINQRLKSTFHAMKMDLLVNYTE